MGSPCSLTVGSSSSWPTGAGQGNSDISLISDRGGGGGGGGGGAKGEKGEGGGKKKGSDRVRTQQMGLEQNQVAVARKSAVIKRNQVQDLSEGERCDAEECARKPTLLLG